MPGKSFKAALKDAYKSVFKAANGVPVVGVTFNGKPYTVDIPNSVPGKVISDQNLTAEKLALLDILPQVVQSGTYVGSGNYVQHGSKNKLTIRFDYFETPVEIHGKSYIVSFDVEAFPNKNNYRTHKLHEIELSPITDADTGRDPAANVTGTAPVEGTRPLNSDLTIPQDAENVNSVDPLLKLMLGGKRVDQSKASNEQFAALAERGDVGVDAAGRLYQVDPAQHIDRREMGGVAERSMNAFQFDHPELHGYYQKAAEALIADADLSLQIIHDRGQENVKAAKQVELILDAMLSDGWITMAGDVVFADRGYLAAKEAILGSRPMAEDSYLPEGLDALPSEADGGMMGETALTEDESAALLAYKSSESYKINAKLRGEGELSEADDLFVQHMDGALTKMPTYIGRVYRNITFDGMGDQAAFDAFMAEYSEGALVAYPAYTSTSTVEDGYPLDGQYVVHMVIEGRSGRDMAGIGNNFEREVLYERQSCFGVSGVRYNQDGSATIYMTEVSTSGEIDQRGSGGPEDAGRGMPRGAETGNPFEERSQAMQQVQKAGELYGDLPTASQGDSVRGSDGRGLPGVRGEEVTDGLGAADAGFDPYSRLQNQTDRFHPEGPNAARPVEVPMEDFDGRKIPKSASTVMGAQGTADDGVRALERQIASGELSFDTIHDADAVGRALETVRGKGFDGALEQYRQAVSASVATKDNTALGQQLLLQAMREGNAPPRRPRPCRHRASSAGSVRKDS